MDMIKKIGAVFVVLTIVFCSFMAVVSAENNGSLPTVNTTLNFVTDYDKSVAQAADRFQILGSSGLLAVKPPQSYIIYKVAKNSPFVASFKLKQKKDEHPDFFVSSDRDTWNPITVECVLNADNKRDYYSEGIGEENKYIKIVICNTAISSLTNCVLESLSFNAPEAGIDIDTKLDFVNDYATAVSRAYKCRHDIMQVYQGGLSGSDTPNTYIIYKTEKNSPVKAKIKWFTDLTKGTPEFYASPDANTWEKLTMTVTQTSDPNFKDFSIPGIGEDNKYLKIVISDITLGAAWHIDLSELSYCASTEAEEKPVTDTTLDFIANGQKDLDRVFRNWNFEISPPAGYKNAAYANRAKHNYIVLNTAHNSPFELTMRVHDSAFGTVTLQVTDDPNDPDSWVPMDVTAVQPKQGGYNKWTFYTTGIGEAYNYVKVSLSISSAWAFCIENISYSAGSFIGPDDSGYEEPDPDAFLPKTNTTLDFVNGYDSAVAKAYMFSADMTHIYQGGVGGSKTPDSYIIYKVEADSPIIAHIKLFANDTAGRPQFFASPDGREWTPVEMKIDVEITGTGTYRYYIEGIGKENRYFKIAFSDKPLGVVYYSDLQKLQYNVNTDPLPYDLSLSFSGDALALARVYGIAPPEAFEHLVGTGLLLTVDYLSGQTNVAKPRLIIAVKPGSGILLQYKVSNFAEALDLFPKFYASTDGKKWDPVTEDNMFCTGTNGTSYSYRATFDSLDKKYEFFSFEYPQTKDYAGIDIPELDDYVPDCMNSGIILTNVSFMRSEKYIGLNLKDNGEEENYSEETETETEAEKTEDPDYSTSPDTGENGQVELCVALSAVSLFAVILLNRKTRKGDRV